MDNKPMNPRESDEWFDELLGKKPPEKELGPDESAIYAAGLIHPDDMELEQILAEHRQQELEAEISANVESVMEDQDILPGFEQMPDDGFIPEQEVPTEVLIQPDEEVQESVSNEVTQFFVPPTGYSEDTPAGQPDAEVPEEADDLAEEEPPQPKGRPKWKKGYGLFGLPQLAATFIWLAIIVAVGISLGRTLWLCCADLMAFGKEDMEAVITITDEDTIDTVSQKLADMGLIRYPGLFKQFAELTDKVDRISEGTFTLNSRLDYNAMINGMSVYASAREEVDIMFPEGYTCADIFELLEEKNVCTVAELEEYAANGELDEYWFLEGVERGDKYCLEGYLFPDTYTFYTNDEPRRVIEKFLDCFDVRFTDIMKERLDAINLLHAERLADEGYGQDYIDEHPITVREAVIIASLIEKESSGEEENYLVSSVIYNRLVDSSQPPYLNIDAALIYGLGGKTDPETGESIPLTSEDLATDNPYNTYLHAGLTPGAICNPGQECLNAALVPEDTDYLYYALDPEAGTHKFFETYSAHQNFLESLDD